MRFTILVNVCYIKFTKTFIEIKLILNTINCTLYVQLCYLVSKTSCLFNYIFNISKQCCFTTHLHLILQTNICKIKHDRNVIGDDNLMKTGLKNILNRRIEI